MCVAGCKLYPYLPAQINISKTWHPQTSPPAKEPTGCQPVLVRQRVPLKVLRLPKQPWITSISSVQPPVCVIFALAGRKICPFPLLILEPSNRVRNRDRWGNHSVFRTLTGRSVQSSSSTDSGGNRAGTAKSLRVIEAIIDLSSSLASLAALVKFCGVFFGGGLSVRAALGPDQTGQSQFSLYYYYFFFFVRAADF